MNVTICPGVPIGELVNLDIMDIDFEERECFLPPDFLVCTHDIYDQNIIE